MLGVKPHIAILCMIIVHIPGVGNSKWYNKFIVRQLDSRSLYELATLYFVGGYGEENRFAQAIMMEMHRRGIE